MVGRISVFGLLAVFVLLFSGCGGDDESPIKTAAQEESYAVGMNVARSIKPQTTHLEKDFIIMGFTDVLSDKQVLSDEDFRKALTRFSQNQNKRRQERQADLAKKNQEAGTAFLAANRNLKDIVELPSGLQYRVLKKGSGETLPKPSDKVTVHYKGTLIDGTEFDSSYSRGKPLVIAVNGVIKGWQDVLVKMVEGEKRQVFIPPHLAYGSNGAGSKIGPNSTLIFTIELIKIGTP